MDVFNSTTKYIYSWKMIFIISTLDIFNVKLIRSLLFRKTTKQRGLSHKMHVVLSAYHEVKLTTDIKVIPLKGILVLTTLIVLQF